MNSPSLLPQRCLSGSSSSSSSSSPAGDVSGCAGLGLWGSTSPSDCRSGRLSVSHFGKKLGICHCLRMLATSRKRKNDAVEFAWP
ncbi:hypothetical protein Mapa_003652 [Marchantia paleacea]|nr:hypothetical protein Mapa_003652 [Marchantia paleacea]